jgi:hypothetical protein
MPAFTKLDGVKASEVDGTISRSVDDVIESLCNHLPTIIANDNGALTFWVDDRGKYRCRATRHNVDHEKRIFKDLRIVRGWVEEWMPWTR